MAPSNSTIILLSSCFLIILVVAGKESSLEKSDGKAEAIAHHYQTVKLSSFLSSSICSPSTKRDKKRGSLEVVHKYGPCSKFSKDMVKPLTMEEILTQDQYRVDSIMSRLKAVTTAGKKDTKSSKATIPARTGTSIGSGDYIVNVGLGTEKKDLSFIFDTGSDLTCTQCQPCAGSCYNQQEPIFEPSASTTYSNISCTSMECSLLPSATGSLPGCSSSTCVYNIQYGDGSFSTGYFAKEKLTLTPNDVINGYMLGCGQDNEGDYGGVTGLLGLGPGELSIVSQTANEYGKVFSYCLPSTDSSTGYLTFGNNQIASNVQYTRLIPNTFYNLNLDALDVGETKIAMNPSVMIIIDSGTVVTRLPPAPYAALRKAFRAQMAQYPLTKPFSILDTCYDVNNLTSVNLPKISMVFDGNVKVDIPVQGILIAASPNQMCFPFATDGDDSVPSIIGNLQQQTMQVVYDVGGEKVGFGPQGCE